MGKKKRTIELDEIDIAVAELSREIALTPKRKNLCNKYVILKNHIDTSNPARNTILDIIRRINDIIYYLKKIDPSLCTVRGTCYDIYRIIDSYTFQTVFLNNQQIYIELYMAKMLLINDIRYNYSIAIDPQFVGYIVMFERSIYDSYISKIEKKDMTNDELYKQYIVPAKKWLTNYVQANDKYYYPGKIDINALITDDYLISVNEINKISFVKAKNTIANIINVSVKLIKKANMSKDSPTPHDDSVWATLTYYVLPKMNDLVNNGIYPMMSRNAKNFIEQINALFMTIYCKKSIKSCNEMINMFNIKFPKFQIFSNSCICSIDEFWLSMTSLFEDMNYDFDSEWFNPMNEWETNMIRVNSKNKQKNLMLTWSDNV